MIKRIDLSHRDREIMKSISVDPALVTEEDIDYSNVVVNKPWGYEYQAFQNENVAVWILHIKQGFQTSLHCHPAKKTSLVVLQGTVVSSNLNGEIELNAGEGLLLEKGVFHSTRALSSGEAIVMETETPINKKDLVRLHDKYGREHAAYEGQYFHSPMGIAPYAHVERLDAAKRPEKKIGDCNIAIYKCETGQDLIDLLGRQEKQIVCVLNGEMKDERRSLSLRHGDVFTSSDVEVESIDPSVNEFEVLIIKNN